MGQKTLVEAAGGSKYRARRGCKRARHACSGAAETNFSSGNSPHPKGPQCQSAAFCKLLERKPQPSAELGARHVSSAAGRAEPFDDR
jgi:hypothetical protein